MKPVDLDEHVRPVAVRFLNRYLQTMTDFRQLWSDIGDTAWADGVTDDPACWFEWVQAYWEDRGADIEGPYLDSGPNELTFPGGQVATLDAPYDGSDPTLEPAIVDSLPGAERAGLDAFRAVVNVWRGTIVELRDALQGDIRS